MRICGLWFVAIFACAFGSESRPASPEDLATIDRKIEARMAEVGLVGAGAAIIIDRKVAWIKGYGFADKQRAVRFTPDTVMNVASISKTFTGVAMMQAVEDGKLSLDKDINTWLPFKVVNPAFPDVPITLRQLATHTSGITDRWKVYERTYHWGGDPTETLDNFLRDFFSPRGKNYSKENFLAFKPGTHREYSNIGAALAGYIVERAVGEKLSTYTKRRIFMPLKMSRSGWLLSEFPSDAHSTLYVAHDGSAMPLQPYGLITYPDGGVRTSVADLSRFFLALLNEGQFDGARILQVPSVAEMLRFQYSDADKPDNVELSTTNSGLFWQTKFNMKFIGHGGSDPGVMTQMLSNQSKDVGLILFCNTSVPEQDSAKLATLMNELWTHAEAMGKSAQ